MKQKLVLSVLLVLFSASMLLAQTVSGTLVDVEGEPLIGASVLEVGTSNGAITDFDGTFSLELTTENPVLEFSYTGFATQKIAVDGRTAFDVTLEQGVALDEVVVTALGISRESKALGYSVQEIDGEGLAEVRATNVVNSLSGKVAGLQISQTASGPGGSSRVIIRGNSSILGNNQPLYIVDGVPIDNSNIDPAIRWGGIDYGDGVSDINPDDIEEISVLKGPNAAALYGSLANNGVVVITTKTGKNVEGIGVEFNSNFTFDNILIKPEFQNQYGHGSRGIIDPDLVDAYGSDLAQASSWGPEMDGSPQLFYDGTTRPYTAAGDDYDDFYQTGQTWTNSVALSGGNETNHFRLSFTNLDNQGIIPTSTFKRSTFNLRAGSKITDRLTADLRLTYVDQEAFNRPYLADAMENPGNAYIWKPRSVAMGELENHKNPDGTMFHYNIGTFRMNPWWAIRENINQDNKDRFFGYASLNYELTDWLDATFRTGQDFYSTNRNVRVALNTRYRPDGSVTQNDYQVQNQSYEFFVKANPQLSDRIGTNLILGTSRFDSRLNGLGYAAAGFNNLGEDFYSITNATSINTNEFYSGRRLNSVYGLLSLDWDRTFFVDFSLRNDWDSTLDPNEDADYLYPGVSTSLVFSELLGGDALSFGKLRASWAQSGNGAPFGILDPVLSLRGQTHLGQPLGYLGTYGSQNEIQNINLPPQGLQPEISTSLEFGVDLRFFNDRLGIDATYYDTETENQILPVQVPLASGYTGAIVNAGLVRNSGVELILRTTPVLNKELRWDINFNFAANRNEVVELYEDLNAVLLGADRAVAIEARPGEPYGNIVGKAYLKDESGNIVVDDNGLPIATPNVRIIGNNTPDWLGGISTNLNWKGFSLYGLVDMRIGGEVFSQTNRYLHLNGNHANTLEGRNGDFIIDGSQVALFDGGNIVVDENGNATSAGVNSTTVQGEDWWKSVFDQGIIDDFVYDASFVKLREISLSYELPRSVMENLPLERIRLSIVGRNLAILSSNLDGLDPEASYNSGNAQGLESGAIPSTRSIGFNVNLVF